MELYQHVGMLISRRNNALRLSLGSRVVELFLQFGYGMMEHSRKLIGEWSSGCVILSPRDLNPTQLSTFAASVLAGGGKVLLDPQFYLPHADHERLVSHDFWPRDYNSGLFWSGAEQTSLLTKLRDLNLDLACDKVILPGEYATDIDEDWLDRQSSIFAEAKSLGIPTANSLATVALSAEVVRSEDSIHAILDAAVDWKVAGIYLVCEHPKGAYLVDDPSWLANVLDLTAGFRLRGRDVVIGYCNQQMLIAGCASATAIASGTWMNVRSFPPDKFRAQYDDEIKKRNTWYYSPDSLSEYKVTFLDIAKRQGMLSTMATRPEMGSDYADILFRGPQPSTVQFTEQAAFRHYLHCLRHQTLEARQPSFDLTIKAHEDLLLRAERILTDLHGVGVTGGMRDFHDIIDTNRAALSVLVSTRGPMLRRCWNTI